MTEVDPRIAELGDAIADLTLAQCALLSTYLEDVHGLKKGATGQIQLPDQVKEDAPPAPAKTSFDVVLEGVPDATKKIAVIKAVREITGLSLMDARSLVDAPPKNVKTGVPESEAKDAASRLEAAGAKITVK